jgi:hypothetical protein
MLSKKFIYKKKATFKKDSFYSGLLSSMLLKRKG